MILMITLALCLRHFLAEQGEKTQVDHRGIFVLMRGIFEFGKADTLEFAG